MTDRSRCLDAPISHACGKNIETFPSNRCAVLSDVILQAYVIHSSNASRGACVGVGTPALHGNGNTQQDCIVGDVTIQNNRKNGRTF